MNISTYTSILTIVLSVLRCPAGSKLLDDQCSTYCYQVVKPLLQYVNTVKSMSHERNVLQNTINLQAETINNLKEMINSRQMKKAQAIKNLNELINSKDLHKAEAIKYLNDLIHSKDLQLAQQIKLSESSESHNRNQQKLIDQYEVQLSSLKSEVQSRDNKIKDLRSENVKIKDLQNEVKACKLTFSCLGKSTDLHVIRVGAQNMTVPCDSNVSKAGAGWTVILRRKDGSVNFNRTWSEYKEGFGDLHGEFFLGLEKIHILTQSQPHELYISLMDFANETRYARYNNFVIGNETEFYKIKQLGRYSGDAGDSMTPHKNRMFSTVDVLDHTTVDCARKHSSGWWFHNCFTCNLNGQYVFEDTGKDVSSVAWRIWKHRPMKFAQMMIRPSKH